MNTLVSDLVNYISLLILLYYLFKKNYLNAVQVILLAITSATPFFMFNFLFQIDSTYFGDAEFYRWSVQKARFLNYDELYHTKDIRWTAIIYSFVPIIFLDTPNSLGFLCKFIFIILMAFCNGILKIDKIYIYLFILYPSAILYTAIGTKDTLVFLMMTLFFIGTVRNNYVLIFIPLFILYNIKLHNALFLIIVLFSYTLFFSKNYKFFFINISSILLISIPFLPKIIDLASFKQLNNIYLYFKYVDGVSNSKSLIYNYEIIYDFLISSIFFYLSPSIFDFQNFFQLIQSLENIIILFLVLFLFLVFLSKNIFRTLFWFSHLLFISGVYGLVVSNPGTLVRYKFSILLSYIIVIIYDFQLNNKTELNI